MTRLTYRVHDTNRATDWRDHAACRNEDPEDFFPGSAGPAAQAQERHAKAVCFVCPSQQPCGLWALQTRQEFGVWGGLSEAERRAILRRRGRRINDVDPDQPATA